MREKLEYFAAWTLLKGFGLMPRRMARAVAATMMRIAYHLRPPLKHAAEVNLKMAFPEWTPAQREALISKMIRNIGWMGAEFSQFPKYNRKNIGDVIEIESHENYLRALERGKGVLFLTGHMGPWELSSFAHSVYGYPCDFLARPIKNARVDALVNGYRAMSGCKVVDKNDSARAILRTLRAGGVIGILADQNTSQEEGVFVPFFGIDACTTAGLARIALRTDASVVPGYAYWDDSKKKYVLKFEPAVELVRSVDEERDVRENTAKFTSVIEEFVRERPDQWLWVHKRWKTRRPGEKSLYDVK